MRAKRNIILLFLVLVFSGCTLENVKECKDGATRCVGDSINTCADGEWWQYTPCEKQKCEDKDGAAVCVRICEKGDTKCSGNTLLTCSDENIWPQIAQGVTCSGGETCMSVQEFSFCANPNSSTEIVEILLEHNIACDENLRLCGENNTLYTCENNELKELQQCGNQICDKAPDGLMACLDICQSGETKCEGNNLVTCTSNRVFGAPEACPVDTVCTKNDESIYACIEKTMSFNLCSADQCIENTWYQCKNGMYDNGTTCEQGCGLNDQGKYACLNSFMCEPGEKRCAGDNIEVCSELGMWQLESSAPEKAVCVIRDNTVQYLCDSGYKLEDNICKLVCEPRCSEDGTMSISCLDNGMSEMTACSHGCNPETKLCDECVLVDYFGKSQCGIPLKTAEDILALRDGVNSGDMSKVPGSPADLSGAVYVVMNDIDMGNLNDWVGIGTQENPFTASIIGKTRDVTVSANITCTSNYCGLFGWMKSARVANLTFNTSIMNNNSPINNIIARVAAHVDESSFDHLTVTGNINSNGYCISGVVGVSVKSNYDNIITSGVIEGTKAIDEPWHRVHGGVTGNSTKDVIKNSLSTVKIITTRDADAGFSGIARDCIFDSVTYVGMITGPDGGSLNPSRVAGIIGNGYDTNTVINSRVISRLNGRDAVGGIIGLVDQGNEQRILNSFAITYVTGSLFLSGMVSYSFKNYQIQNAYSLTKNVNSFYSESASVNYGYYDKNLSKQNAVSGTNIDTVTYDSSKMMLETNKVSLVEQLNAHLEECNKLAPAGHSCHQWIESKAVNLENLVGLKDIQLPWPADDVLEEEYQAIANFNDSLKVD